MTSSASEGVPDEGPGDGPRREDEADAAAPPLPAPGVEAPASSHASARPSGPPGAPPSGRARGDRGALLLVVAAVLALGGLVGELAVRRAGRLAYGSPDDAMNLQAVCNAARGGAPRYSGERWEGPPEANILASHLVASTLVFAPVAATAEPWAWALRSKAIATLLGAVPLFLLARRRLGCARRALAVAGLFLLSPLVLSQAARFTSNGLLALACVPLAAERLAAGRRAPAAALLLAGFLDREESLAPVCLLALGLALGDRAGRRLWLGLAALSIALVLAYLGVVRPALGGGTPDHVARFAHLGDGPWKALAPLLRPGAFWGALLAPEAVALLAGLLVPLGPAALAAPRWLLCGLIPWVGVSVSAVASDRVLGPYLVVGAPFLFVALVEGLAWLRARRGRLDPSLGALGVAALGTLAAWGIPAEVGPLARYRPLRVLDPATPRIIERLNPHHVEARALLARIPRAASVSASNTTHLLLADRRWLYPFPVRREEVDVVVVDERTDPFVNPRWPDAGPAAHAAAVAAALAEPGARVERAGPLLVIWRRPG